MLLVMVRGDGSDVPHSVRPAERHEIDLRGPATVAPGYIDLLQGASLKHWFRDRRQETVFRVNRQIQHREAAIRVVR